MGSIQLQTRPLYGIGTVARLTGIKPDTLRIWERRYQLGASHKSSSGRRQYTQADLEHLQLVAALVSDGARIGEIAASERRTLEMMLRAREENARNPLPEPKPRVAFVGHGLCDWLEEHQGCLVNVNATLVPGSLGDMDAEVLAEIGTVDGLVVESGALNNARLEAVEILARTLQADNVLVLHQCSSERWRDVMESKRFFGADYPPDSSFLAFHLSRSVAEKASNAGAVNLGDLVQGKPRLFNESELTAARTVQSSIDCECPRHITDLVRALATFEEFAPLVGGQDRAHETSLARITSHAIR